MNENQVTSFCWMFETHIRYIFYLKIKLQHLRTEKIYKQVYI